MEIQNSYILILNKVSQDSGEKKQKDFVHALKKGLEQVSKSILVIECHPYYQILQLSFEGEVSAMKCSITIHGLKDCFYTDVSIIGDSQDKVIEVMESIHKALGNESLSNTYALIITYDAISEYYCNLIFPSLNKLERDLRHLFFNVFIVKYGRDYHTKGLSEEIQNKAKKNLRVKSSNKDFELMTQCFYSLDLGDIEHVLFEPSWTEAEEAEKDALLHMLNDDMSSISQDDLKDQISHLGPKTTWQRLFAEKIDRDMDSMQKLLDEIRKFRNCVAHSKIISKEEYMKCKNTIEAVDEDILSALKITYERDFATKYDTQMKASMEALSQSIQKALSAMVSLSKLYEQTSKISAIANAAANANSALLSRDIPPSLKQALERANQIAKSNIDLSKLASLAALMNKNDNYSLDEQEDDDSNESSDQSNEENPMTVMT